MYKIHLSEKTIQKRERNGQMITQRNILLGLLIVLYMMMSPATSFGKEKLKSQDPFEIPSHVLTISKENTFPNTSEDQEIVEPSALTKSLIDELEIPIKNPDLIKLLNETSLKPSPIGIGYRGMIFIGHWPLNYQSEDTTINWEYQKINENELNNIGGEQGKVLYYNQLKKTEVKGALTNKITHASDIKNMILLATKSKTKLPLSFQTVVGENTRKDQSYNIPVEKYGTLKTYAPAVNEKGQITFGEVYIELKGTKKTLVIKNVTKQGIGAWIPIQDHVSFSFQLR